MALLQEVLLSMREKNFEKIEKIKTDLSEQLSGEKIFQKEEDFFNRVGPGAYELNRHIPAESFFPSSVHQKKDQLCIAVR